MVKNINTSKTFSSDIDTDVHMSLPQTKSQKPKQRTKRSKSEGIEEKLVRSSTVTTYDNSDSSDEVALQHFVAGTTLSGASAA